MRSHLTRHVFRAILDSEQCSISYCSCLATRLQRPHRRIPRFNRAPSRRNIFEFSRKPDPWLKEPDLTPGFDKMLDLTSLLSMHDRPPPPDQLIKAFNAFFKEKLRRKEPLQEIQAYHAARTLKHLQETNKEQEGFGLTTEDLQLARDALGEIPQDDELETHNKLARTLNEEIKRRRAGEPGKYGERDILGYIRVLSQTGDSLEARTLVLDSWKNNPSTIGKIMWMRILTGFAREKNNEELLRTLSMMEANGAPFDAKMHCVMATFYASRDDVEETKRWYSRPIADGEAPLYRTNIEIMRFCIRNNELVWGKTVFRSMLEGNPTKETWDLIFQWAAALGKGIDEIDRMMEVMVKRNPDDEQLRPDIDTINGLIEVTNPRDNPDRVERYMLLGQKWGMNPNARTYILQMDDRIEAGDVDGARASYRRLLGEDVKDNEDLHVVNKFITALLKTRPMNYEEIMKVVGDLNERRARLKPETVAALCVLHLRREELPEIITLIKDHSYHYSMSQRAIISNTFISFIKDRNNHTQMAWDAYTLLIHAFDEISVDTRVELMEEFFQRKRSDMASHVFGNIRQHTHRDDRPTVEAYVKCFSGIAEAADVEALEMVHNMLKLDTAIEPTTKLYNSLMLAYNACGMADRSLEFWEDITQSIEGPSRNSIRIAFRACEVSWAGEKEANKLWGRLESMKVKINRQMLADYLAVLAAHGSLDQVYGFFVDDRLKPDTMTLGVIYNSSLPGPKREEVEKWIMEKYPEKWRELTEKIGWKQIPEPTVKMTEEGDEYGEEEEEEEEDELEALLAGRYGSRVKMFDIDRRLDP